MKRFKCLLEKGGRGSAPVLSLIFIVMFSAMARMCGSNVQVSQNQRTTDATRGCAESGLEVLRYWMSKVEMSGTGVPRMNLAQFYSYATNVLSATADLSRDATYDNVRIPAGRNPSFSGHATLRGVLYVEAPNEVTFSGGVTITGIVVASGNSDLLFNRSGLTEVPAGFAPEIVMQYNPSTYAEVVL